MKHKFLLLFFIAFSCMPNLIQAAAWPSVVELTKSPYAANVGDVLYQYPNAITAVDNRWKAATQNGDGSYPNGKPWAVLAIAINKTPYVPKLLNDGCTLDLGGGIGMQLIYSGRIENDSRIETFNKSSYTDAIANYYQYQPSRWEIATSTFGLFLATRGWQTARPDTPIYTSATMNLRLVKLSESIDLSQVKIPTISLVAIGAERTGNAHSTEILTGTNAPQFKIAVDCQLETGSETRTIAFDEVDKDEVISNGMIQQVPHPIRMVCTESGVETRVTVNISPTYIVAGDDKAIGLQQNGATMQGLLVRGGTNQSGNCDSTDVLPVNTDKILGTYVSNSDINLYWRLCKIAGKTLETGDYEGSARVTFTFE